MLRTVELPLATPFLMAGVRTASIEVVATSTLAAYVSYTDLGTPVIAGLNTNDTVEAFAGALLVALLAAVVAVGLGVVQRSSPRSPCDGGCRGRCERRHTQGRHRPVDRAGPRKLDYSDRLSNSTASSFSTPSLVDSRGTGARHRRRGRAPPCCSARS